MAEHVRKVESEIWQREASNEDAHAENDVLSHYRRGRSKDHFFAHLADFIRPYCCRTLQYSASGDIRGRAKCAHHANARRSYPSRTSTLYFQGIRSLKNRPGWRHRVDRAHSLCHGRGDLEAKQLDHPRRKVLCTFNRSRRKCRREGDLGCEGRQRFDREYRI